MPLAKIEVRKSRSPSEISAMIEAVYLSQRDPASELDLGFNLNV